MVFGTPPQGSPTVLSESGITTISHHKQSISDIVSPNSPLPDAHGEYSLIPFRIVVQAFTTVLPPLFYAIKKYQRNKGLGVISGEIYVRDQ